MLACETGTCLNSLAANGQKRPYFSVSFTEIYFRLNLIYCQVKILGGSFLADV